MKKRIYILLAIFALLTWAIISLLKTDLHQGPRIGSPAPSFSLMDSTGKKVGLESLRGSLVLLNFWATWCGPCRHEMPSLEALSKKYQDRGLVVLGVSVDEEGWGSIREFLKVVPVSFPILLDQDQKVSEQYETYRIPETYLIDGEGKVVAKFVGPQDYDQPLFYRQVERYLP